MMKILSIIFLYFFSLEVYSQTTISGFVIDENTKKGIPYATIINTNTKQGLYTTGSGYFKIAAYKNDSIYISCVGYNPITISVSYFINNNNSSDTFYLIPYTKELEEVIVAPVDWSKYREMNMGYAKLKSKLLISRGTGFEYAVYIPNTKILDAYICKLNYKIEKLRLDTVAVRLHLYAVSADNLPSVELLDSNYVEILEGKADKVFSFDISKFKIKLPTNGVFVGIEWLGVYNSNTNSIFSKQAVEPLVGFNFKKKEQLTYERISNGKWEKSDARKLSIGSHIEKEMFDSPIPNLSFGIVIKAPKRNKN
ncbi:MAG: hypothetical protein AMXMBFR79_10850 [Chitinophagaceae bacterium]